MNRFVFCGKRFLIGSLGAALSIFVITFGFVHAWFIGSEYHHPLISLTTAGIATLVGIIICIIWVLPIFLIFELKNIKHPVFYIFVGIVPGPAFIFMMYPFGMDSLQGLLMQSLFCSFVGTCAAIVFWYLIRIKSWTSIV